MANYFGIDFAPLHIPLKRRMQTLTIFIHVLLFAFFPVFFSIVTLLMLLTSYWWVAVGYMAWLWYDINMVKISQRGGRRSEWLRNARFMDYYRDYFPISLVKTADLDPSKNYLFGYHPHGIVPWGAWCHFASNATGFNQVYPGIRSHLLTLEINLTFPIVRAYELWMGGYFTFPLKFIIHIFI